MDVGLMIRSKRKEKGLTLKQLAVDVGMSYTYLSQIELGDRKATPETLKKLTDVLDPKDYAVMLEAAGYHELAEREVMKSIYEDFGDEFNIVDVLMRNKALENALDIKTLLQLKDASFESQNIHPKYNGHLLNEQDRQRILTMLDTLFPDYK